MALKLDTGTVRNGENCVLRELNISTGGKKAVKDAKN
jgi:hypothetical protein